MILVDYKETVLFFFGAKPSILRFLFSKCQFVFVQGESTKHNDHNGPIHAHATSGLVGHFQGWEGGGFKERNKTSVPVTISLF